ncbi:protein SMAX1-LIKE 3-like [Aegilops tauschii subsp. strangulata]|uniref:protein SMAX1-LIKE 3-like n=1 Tax=Aegilops tauschii subsp. strangulata TaxID=200361 RepID=UPI003CC8B723
MWLRLAGRQAHALGESAAAVVQQAVSLAGRRGHAQVTPLHIASAMLLASPATAGILRAACARSQSHLLQHSALDLCLGVALGRLPLAKGVRAASAVAHDADRVEPAPSNAFVAALKRAQAQAHRGRTGGKVELEQLVISLLDDPSVDRVMRSAGLSSSQVRASVVSSEQLNRASSDVTPSPSPVPMKARAGGQASLSLQTVPEPHTPVVADVVPGGSECQANKAKSGSGQPAFLCGTMVDATTAILPPWLHRHKCTTYTSTTYCGTSLQANGACSRPKFTELTAQNLRILCDALEQRVPRHANIVPGISSTVLRCRSGVTRRRAGNKATTCLFFRGRDGSGKMAVALELARLVFGSYAKFTALQGSTDIPARTGKLAIKRQRSPHNGGDIGARLFEAIEENPHRVILIDEVDRLDSNSEILIKNAIAGGTMAGGCNGNVVGLEDVILVLSSDLCESASVASASSPRVKRRQNNEDKDDATDIEVRPRRRLCWDLNVCVVDGEEEEDNLADDEGFLNVVDGVFLFN